MKVWFIILIGNGVNFYLYLENCVKCYVSMIEFLFFKICVGIKSCMVFIIWSNKVFCLFCISLFMFREGVEFLYIVKV